jgi:hemoglobin
MLRQKKTIYEEMGGSETIEFVVKEFYSRVLADTRIAKFFEGVDMGRQMHKQSLFLGMIFGGPEQFTGKSLSVAHHPLLLRGLGDEHVDALLEDLGATLVALKFRRSLIARILTTANSFRNEVLSRELPQDS